MPVAVRSSEGLGVTARASAALPGLEEAHADKPEEDVKRQTEGAPSSSIRCRFVAIVVDRGRAPMCECPNFIGAVPEECREDEGASGVVFLVAVPNGSKKRHHDEQCICRDKDLAELAGQVMPPHRHLGEQAILCSQLSYR